LLTNYVPDIFRVRLVPVLNNHDIEGLDTEKLNIRVNEKIPEKKQVC